MKVMIERLKQKGIRMTPQRRVIIEILENDPTHPTADDIFDQVTKKLPGVSLATVYNTLEMLVRMGEIKKLNLGEGKSRFDLNVKPHIHFICFSCNRVEDWGNVAFDTNFKEKRDYQLLSYEITFWGYCPVCKSESKQIS